jgi:hypothetical protein
VNEVGIERGDGPVVEVAVTVYSPPMTGNRPELPGSYRGFEVVNPVVAQ